MEEKHASVAGGILQRDWRLFKASTLSMIKDGDTIADPNSLLSTLSLSLNFFKMGINGWMNMLRA